MDVQFDSKLKVIKRVIPQNVITNPTEGNIHDDSVLEVHSDILGDISFVRKKTQYVENPADGMLILRNGAPSQLSDLTQSEGREFIRILFSLANSMHSFLGYGYPTISINQQRDCKEIPAKYLADGTEVKVQTIDQLHAHIFIEDRSGYTLMELGELEGQDLYDHIDPYGIAASEVLGQVAKEVIRGFGLEDRYTVRFQGNSFPMGIEISVAKPFDPDKLSDEIFAILREIQSRAYSIYAELESLITTPEGTPIPRSERVQVAREWLSQFSLSEASYRQLYTLIVAIKPKLSDEKRAYLRLIQGPALTWVLQDGYGQTDIYVTPRIFSRGNAMEVLGVYVDNEGVSSSERTQQLNKFFMDLEPNLDPGFRPTVGPAVKGDFALEVKDELKNRIGEQLSTLPYLSPSLRNYYIDILVDLIGYGHIIESELYRALSDGRHIHEILQGNERVSSSSSENQNKTAITFNEDERLLLPEGEEEIQTNSRAFKDGITAALCDRPFSQYFTDSTPLTSNSMVLEVSGTSPKYMICNGIPFVAVKIGNSKTYLDNYYTVADILQKSALDHVCVVPEIAIIRSNGSYYFVSRYMGTDYETAILDEGKGYLQRELEGVALGVETALVNHGIFFRNIAPRNLIRGGDGKVYIIDFDHLVKMDDETAVMVYMMGLNRLVWFADIFNSNLIHQIFPDVDIPFKDRIRIRAGNFEKKFVGEDVEEITLDEYERIFQHTIKFERRDIYKGVVVLGHQLGRFISDYWTEDQEAELTRLIAAYPDRIDEIRAVLYFASRLDQELYLRHSYGLNIDHGFLSLKTFEKLKTSRLDISSFFILNRGLSFGERYNQFIRECGL